jgi:glucosyl-3-phosphoglycerate synthase
MEPLVRRWWEHRSYLGSQFTAEALTRDRQETVAAVIPALDEEATVGRIVTAIREHLMSPGASRDDALVDEVVVVDSGSTDATATVAGEAGARVVSVAEVLPQLPPVAGKGEALWRGLAATTSDIVVFLDSDVTDFSPDFVVGLVGPLLADSRLSLVKATYDRPLAEASGTQIDSAGGGRVTELVARPLLALFFPRLAGFVQPLSGEYAARRTLLEQVPFPTGYGVEIGLLIDALDAVGLDGLAQVDLGRRSHSHSGNDALGRMSMEIMQTVLARLAERDRITLSESLSTRMVQFTRPADADAGAGGYVSIEHDLSPMERPPLTDVVAGSDRSQTPRG